MGEPGGNMIPSLGWVSISRRALAQATHLIDSSGDGTVDEIGVLALHRAFADRFFPGTSVLHTRLRYALFTPWLYASLATEVDAGVRDPREKLAALELRLATCLVDGIGGTSGVIGGTLVAKGKTAVQLSSESYWSALGSWGIVLRDRWNRPFRRSAILSRYAKRSRHGEHDADGRPLVDDQPLFAKLPDAPTNFLSDPLNFDLNRKEAEFLRERLLSARAEGQPSLLAHLVNSGVTKDDELSTIDSGADQHAVSLALNVAQLAGLARAIYAALVETAQEVDGVEPGNAHREHLDKTLAHSGTSSLKVDLHALGGQSQNLLRLLECTQTFAAGRTTLLDLTSAYATQERSLKGARRVTLGPTPTASERRKDWKATLAQPLHYRWPWVRRLLLDLQAGLTA